VKIAIVGSGYVGLVAGACFADSGTNVMCIDVNEAKLAKLRAGEVPFFEPRLADLLKRNWPHRLDYTSSLADGIRGREVVFVAVGTPPQEDGSADLSYVLGVAEQVAKAAEHDLALVLKSTVPVGTNEKVRAVVERFAKHKISVVSNPEFLKEGDAVNDFFKPDRIVIGTDDNHAFELLERLYSPYNRQRSRIQRMSPKSAEIVKYASNALLATKISFMNEIANLCDVAGGDVEQGVAICGSGIGISIACNRNPKIRAALCFNSTMSRLARQHNNANILCLGERLIGTEVALDILKTFLETEFEGGRHAGRVDKLSSC